MTRRNGTKHQNSLAWKKIIKARISYNTVKLTVFSKKQICIMMNFSRSIHDYISSIAFARTGISTQCKWSIFSSKKKLGSVRKFIRWKAHVDVITWSPPRSDHPFNHSRGELLSFPLRRLPHRSFTIVRRHTSGSGVWTGTFWNV